MGSMCGTCPVLHMENFEVLGGRRESGAGLDGHGLPRPSPTLGPPFSRPSSSSAVEQRWSHGLLKVMV